MAFTVYRPGAQHNFPQASYHPSNRATNQIVCAGEDVVIPVQNGILWLEQLHSSAGVTIKDGDGNSIFPSSILTLESDISPVRCDHGIAITGTVKFVKGFLQEDCLL